jgi:hypothetical protein
MSVVCHYHRDRPGVGVCIRCRAVICAACTTRLDGVNHCHACLSKLAAPEQKKRSGDGGATVMALLVVCVAWLVFFGVGVMFEGRWAP